MKQHELRNGLRVLYRPLAGKPEEYAGKVDGKPWQLGDGTWVVNLSMEGGYIRATNRSRVNAASLEHLRLACCECNRPATCTYRRANSKLRDGFCDECEGNLRLELSGKTLAECRAGNS